jgi:serine phosphatase RsbU (regulator of sigma subunit)
VCARIEPHADGTLAAAVALGGHPPPYLISASGQVVPVGVPGPLLGAFDEATWDETVVIASPGDTLVFYTDGVTDTRGEAGELFGQERLAALLAGASAIDAEEVATRIDGALQTFEHGVQRDDVAVLVLRVGRPDEPSLLAAAARP